MKYPQLTNRINSLLAEKGIKKETFYKDCEITSAAFSQWATGKTSPRLSKLEKIAVYLNVPMAYLMGYSPLPVFESPADAGQQKSPASEETELSKVQAETINRLKKMDFTKLKQANEMLDFLDNLYKIHD